MAADHYIGPERRAEQRRKIKDRRAVIRFEPHKTPRRAGRDRRVSNISVWDGRDK